MTTRQEAVDRARQIATEAMHAKGEGEPMIIAHTADALMAFPLAGMMDSPTTKDIAAEMIGVKMREHDAQVYVFMSEA
jgi:hypothetical protein